MMLPHTRTARFLMKEGEGRIPAAHPLVIDGRAPAFLGIELGAQAAAALSHGQPSSGNSAGGGLLVRIREAVFLQPDLPAGMTLQVSAELEAAAPPLAIYRIRVSVGGVEAVRATISVTTTTAENKTTDAARG